MKKIKVLHFPIRNTSGGVTKTAIKYWKYIDRSRFHFGFATCEKVKLDFEDELINSGAEVHYISCYAEENEDIFATELRNILVENHYDAIHLNTSWWKGCVAEKIAKECGIKVIVVHARSSGIDLNDEQKREEAYVRHQFIRDTFCKDMATDYLACSAAAAEFLFGEKVSGDEVVILHNALDINRFSYSQNVRTAVREKLNIRNQYVIGNIGRMSYAKNHIFLLNCFYLVQKEIPQAVLLLLGDGELRKDIEKRAVDLGIKNKVIFTGNVDDVERYLQAMDVFAFPSQFEGLGNVLIEAQAAGLKCLASDAVPLETQITDCVEYLVLEEDIWVEKLIQLSRPYQRRNMSQEIKNAGYDIQSEIKVLERIYAKAIHGHIMEGEDEE